MKNFRFFWLLAISVLTLPEQILAQGPWNSAYVPSMSNIPATLTAATPQTISITMRNTGSQLWYNPGFIHLRQTTQTSLIKWMPIVVPLPRNPEIQVPTNGTYTFQFTVSPPRTAVGQRYTIRFRVAFGSSINYLPDEKLGSEVIALITVVGPAPDVPPDVYNAVSKRAWTHKVAGSFDVYDFPTTRVSKLVGYVPWSSTPNMLWSGKCLGLTSDASWLAISTEECGEYIQVVAWDDWSRDYIPFIPEDFYANAGFRIRVFSNHDLVNGKMKKPIVISQGFDPSYGTPDQFNYDQFAAQLIDEFESIRTVDPATGKLAYKKITSSATNLLRTLYEDGQDIVLVTFKDPNAKIEDNSRLIQAVMMMVHFWLENPDAGTLLYSDLPIKIMGPSMGGLVCRHAIQTFQSRIDVGGNRPPNITTFVSFDTPNRGAVIPLSLQAFVDYFHTEAADVAKIYANLTGPVAQEMLMYQSKMGRLSRDNSTGRTINYNTIQITDYEDNSGGYGMEHGRFMADINSATMDQEIYDYPSPVLNLNRHIRMSAIANGSGIGESHGFTPAAYIGDARFKVTSIIPGSSRESDWYLFASAVSGTPTRVFSGGGSVFFPLILQYDFNEPVFTENLPGSGRPTYRIISGLWDRAEANFPTIKILGGDFSVDTWWPYWDNVFSDNSHAFIPTLSALGLVKTFGADWDVNRLPDWFYNFRNNAASLESSTPRQSIFDHLYVPEHNQDHVMLTPENKGWLLYELNAAYNAPSMR